MNNLESVYVSCSSGGLNEAPNREKMTCGMLPEELIEEVFSFLDTNELLHANQASKLLNRISLEPGKRELCSTLKFADLLSESSESTLHSEKLKNVFSNGKAAEIKEFAGLNLVGKAVAKLKEQILETLIDLKPKELDDLRKKTEGKRDWNSFFEDAARLKGICQKIPDLLKNPLDPTDSLLSVAANLAELGCMNRIIELTGFKEGKPLDLDPMSVLHYTFTEITLNLFRDGFVGAATEIFNRMAGKAPVDIILLQEMIFIMLDFEDFEGDLEVVLEFVEKSSKAVRREACDVIYEHIIIDLAAPYAIKTLNRIIKTANRIGDEVIKEGAFLSLCRIFVKEGKVKEALEIADEIVDSKVKGLALKSVCKALANEVKIKEALEIADKIVDEREKDWALEIISAALVRDNKVKKALEIADKIVDNILKGLALGYVCEALARDGKVKEALEIADKIADNERKSWALKNVCEALAEVGKLDEALEIADQIVDDGSKNRALKIIFAALIKPYE